MKKKTSVFGTVYTFALIVGYGIFLYQAYAKVMHATADIYITGDRIGNSIIINHWNMVMLWSVPIFLVLSIAGAIIDKKILKKKASQEAEEKEN